MATNKEERKVILAYLCVCIVWGSTYLAIRIGVSEFPPAIFAGIRFVVAGLLMVGFAWLKGLEFPKTPIDIRRIAVVGLFLLLGGNGLVVWAEQWVHSGIASLLVATVPLFMAILELMLPNRKSIGFKGWSGLILGFAGVVLLVFTHSDSGAIDLKGALILLTGTLMWAMGSIYSKSFQASGSIVSHIGIEMLAGGIGLSIVGMILGETSRFHVTLRGIGALLYLIFFGSILAYSCYIYILQKWPAAKAGTYAYVNPPVAVLLGSLILDEPLSFHVIASTGVILMGVFLVQTSKGVPASQGNQHHKTAEEMET
ncbi:EamA family transporter [Thermotalea metallivorans]|uniref:Putative inner membrane transporter YedA n=1 Tax=Thermotalea metallivorans TaxID=520762 RepID=A0A140L0X4_9FIRM|nr:EamA family transporter [Thermotalea metallivorans]KXG74199.1 putative inner membrane transporter YedA [Thermotalea metallivorans]